MGLNEAAGYGGVALAAAATGWLAAELAPLDVIVVAGAAVAAVGFVGSLLLVRDTAAWVALEQRLHHPEADGAAPPLRRALAGGTYADPGLRSCSQAGFVNNLNDGLAWGLVPLYLAANGAGLGQIGLVAGIYPAVWGAGQIAAGAWSDRIGRKPLIVAGMLLQALALAVLAASGARVAVAAAAAALLGAGTALVYPTLIAAISDLVPPVARAPQLGVYRFWRDGGYAGAILAGALADIATFEVAIATVSALTALSGAWVYFDMPRPPRSPAETLRLSAARGRSSVG